MSKLKSPADNPSQIGLFERLAEPLEPMNGDFFTDPRIRQAVRQAIKNSAKDRHQIAMEMNRLLEPQEVRKTDLDSWTRSDDAWRIPANVLSAFCEVTGDLSVIQVVLEPLKVRLTQPGEDRWSEIGRLEMEVKERNERIKELKRQ